MKKLKGSLQEKNGKLYLVLNVRYVDGTKQKWFALNLTSGASKYKINRKVKEIYDKIEYEKYNTLKESAFIEKCKNSTIEYFLDFFLEYKKTNVQQVTYDNYYNDVKIIRTYFEKYQIKLKDYSLLHIEGFLNYLSSKNLNSTTINRYLNLLGNIFNYAISLGILKKNIVKQLERPKIRKKEFGYYSAKQIKKLCQKLEKENSIYSLPIILAATYGLRRSEVIGLLWSSIDFEQNKIYINNKVICSQKGAKPITYSSHIMKTKSSERTLPLLPEIKKFLKIRQNEIEQNRVDAIGSYNNEYLDYVCVDDNGKRLDGHTLYINFTKLLKKYNMPHIRFHDLRHSCASMLVAKKVSIKTIQEWLGHSSFRTTANIYSHTDFTLKKECGRIVQKLLFEHNDKPLNSQQILYLNTLKNRITELEKQLAELN